MNLLAEKYYSENMPTKPFTIVSCLINKVSNACAFAGGNAFIIVVSLELVVAMVVLWVMM